MAKTLSNWGFRWCCKWLSFAPPSITPTFVLRNTLRLTASATGGLCLIARAKWNLGALLRNLTGALRIGTFSLFFLRGGMRGACVGLARLFRAVRILRALLMRIVLHYKLRLEVD
jgi:hypothetical protein